MGCNPCVEPNYKHIHAKSNLSGEFVRTNDFLVRDLQSRDLWDEQMLKDLKYFDGSIQHIDRIPPELKALYKTAFEIEYVDSSMRRGPPEVAGPSAEHKPLAC